MIRSINILLSLTVLLLIGSCHSNGGSGDISSGDNGGSDGGDTAEAIVDLESLQIVNERFDQIFQADQTDYTATVGFLAQSINVQAKAVASDATVMVDDITVDANGLSQPVALLEGDDTVINVVVSHNGGSKTYHITVSRELATAFAEQAFLNSSNPETGDEFGYSVAVSGDTLAVGTWLEDGGNTAALPDDNSALDSGAVYVFTRNGGAWTEQAYLKASNAEAGDQFGYSVALSGDTLAVGANLEDSSDAALPDDNNAIESGAVYVFTRSGTTWTEQAYLKASNIGDQDHFGVSLALDKDTLAVGTIEEDGNSTVINGPDNDLAFNAGAVYVFTRSNDIWTEEAYIKASDAASGDRFGNSVSLSGDTLAVGASEKNTWNGAAYVFTRSGTTWSEQAPLVAGNPGIQDYFGISVSVSGDTLAVGAYLEDSNSSGVDAVPNNVNNFNAGAVYIFVRSGTVWSQQNFIKASNPDRNDLFGKVVALSGDVLVVGADQEDSDQPGINPIMNDGNKDFGAIYVYVRNGASWTEQFFVKPSTTLSNDLFGSSAAVAGDTIAVGVPANSNSTGTVYIFE